MSAYYNRKTYSNRKTLYDPNLKLMTLGMTLTLEMLLQLHILYTKSLCPKGRIAQYLDDNINAKRDRFA